MDYSLGEFKINLEPFQRFLQSRALTYCAVFLLVLKIFSIAIFINFTPNVFFADVTKGALVNMVNESRKTAGAGELSESAKLDQAAELKARDMITREYFSHNSPEGVTPWHWFSETGYDYKYAGENLAVGFFDSIDVFHAWLNSASHRENLLNSNYKEVGTAVLQGFGHNNAIVVVQMFGTLKTPQNAPEATAETPAEVSGGAVVSNEPIKGSGQEKVLAQYSENISFFEKVTGNTGSDFYLKVVNFISYENTEFLQYLIYIFLLISVLGAVSSLYMGQQKQRQRFLFRSFLAFVILLSALFLNREMLFLISTPEILI